MTLGALLLSGVSACGESDSEPCARHPEDHEGAHCDAHGEHDTDTVPTGEPKRVPCGPDYPSVREGLAAELSQGSLQLVSADLVPARQQVNNDWVVELLDPQGEPLANAQVRSARSFMEVHNHYGAPDPKVRPRDQVGQFDLDDLRFRMPGPWDVIVTIAEGEQTVKATLRVCVE